MVRYRWFRKRLKEIAESSTTEKILLILPFFILSLDLYLLHHAFIINDVYIIIPVFTLFIFSIAEILVTIDEIHQKAKCLREKNKKK